ncbi:hypothetical protein AYO41_03180 [Verrucomicrobia bacterium SCGC AG-212-E04]|nr:hypothetical protein AYO41_03180 [Verrucomicrobia bacterium SCGC AG-212-E04]
MNIAIPLNRCFEGVSFLAQVPPTDDQVSWAAVVTIGLLVAVVVMLMAMRRGQRSRVNQVDAEIPPGDPFAVARKDEAELASEHVRAADQIR